MAAQPGDEAPTGSPDLSHVVFPDDQTCVIDNEWFLTEGDGAVFPAEVVTHLRRRPRRPCTIAAFVAPPRGEAWRGVPTTILLGRSDELLPPPMQEWASSHFDDVRVVEGDHFLLFLQPNTVAATVLEALDTAPSSNDASP
jgi:pimeloyl-ACP methyl ester carboxylesterase